MRRIAALVPLLLLVPAAARATTLSVTPAPANPSSACPAGDPCSLAHAIQVAASGDDIALAPGGYDLNVQKNLFGISIHGLAGQAPPQVVESNNVSLNLSGGGLAHLGVVQTSASGNSAVNLTSGSSIADATVRCANACPYLLGLTSSSAHDVALVGPTSIEGVDVTGANITLRNITAIVGGTNSFGLKAWTSGGTTTVDLRNSILRGASADLATVNAGGTVTLSYGWCDARAGSEFKNGGTITDLGGDVREDPPRFADAAGGNVHLLADSALVDAGTADALGTTDFDGDARTLGAAPDIGADEVVIGPPLADTGDASGVAATSATVAGSVTPDGRATTYRFEWGTSTSYGQASADTTAGNGSTAVPVSTALSGLTADTVYHYRVVATSAFGTAAGPDRVFRTAAAATAPAPPDFGGVRSRTKRARLDKQGRIAVRLACPRSAVTACMGVVRLELPLATAAAHTGDATFAIPSGKVRTVRLRLKKAARRMVGRKGLRAELVMFAGDGAGRQAPWSSPILILRGR